MTRFVLATPDADFRKRVSEAFNHKLNGDLRVAAKAALSKGPETVVEALAGAPGEGTEVVVLGPGMPPIAALELAALFDQQRPEISVVVVAEPTPRLWERALRAGVREVIPPDAEVAELGEALQRASQTAARRRDNVVAAAAQQTPVGRIFTTVSPKGGSGKTTVAVNLAVALAQEAPGKVVLVDLDVQFGDVANYLRILPEQTLADAVAIDGLDAMTAKVLLTAHDSGLYVLCAPSDPAIGERITAEQCASVLKLLTQEFAYVVVDTSAGLTEQTLAALEASSDILFICSMDIGSVRSLRKELEALDELGMTSQGRHFVLNRADSRVGLQASEIEQTVGLPVEVSVPSSRSVPLAVNQGIPVVLGDARSTVAKSIRQLLGPLGVGIQDSDKKVGRRGKRRDR
jgi:pilus assembly protein CpaE